MRKATEVAASNHHGVREREGGGGELKFVRNTWKSKQKISDLRQTLTCSSSPGCIYTAGPAALSVQCSELVRGRQGK